MSNWTNDAVPNHNGNGFRLMNEQDTTGGIMDFSAFLPTPGQFNQAQLQQQQVQQQAQQQQQQRIQAMQNGQMRNASPSAFQNPSYQTNSLIPSKRPRPGEESIAGSPTPNPGMLPGSRSQTPQQQNFSGFQPGQMQQANAGGFPHLQPNGSANASPSPIMANQIRPGSVPQRVATASPHPFSPSNQQFGSQTSPNPSEQGTPQPNTFMQNMPQGFNANFAPSPSNSRQPHNPTAMSGGQNMSQQMGQMGHNMFPMQQQQLQQQSSPPAGQHQSRQPSMSNMTEQQKMAAYQLRLQQQLQGNMQMQAQMQGQQMGRGMMPKQQIQGVPNGQMPPGQGGMMRRPMPAPNPEQFMKSLVALMSARGLPLDQSPMIGDRPVSLVMLFQAVQSKGGYKPVTAQNGWPFIAQALGFPPQVPTVPMALKQIYDRNLLKFEEVWQAQQKQRFMAQQQAQQGQQGAPQRQLPPNQVPQGQMAQGPHQASQPQQPQQQLQQLQHQHQQQPQQTPAKPSPSPMNGFPTPLVQQQSLPNITTPTPNNRNNTARALEAPVQHDFSEPSPSHVKGGAVQAIAPNNRPVVSGRTEKILPRAVNPQQEEYLPCSRQLSTYGGIDLAGTTTLAMDLSRWEPDVPTLHELGNIDIHALTKSLQSGIHGEIRLALDVLAALSNSPIPNLAIQLRYCDDLIDALIDCAEEQLDLLAEHTAEVSDEIQLTSYEELMRASRLEQWAVKEIPAFGSNDYELDRAVDKLICITTILRNMSFPGEQNDNHFFLAEETVIKFLCVVIRYLGTRTMLLRTHGNTLDFMKDMVVFLSNVAGTIEISSREQALCLLQFLLSFAPGPGPSKVDEVMMFASYDPARHGYLPHAVDALAKLLARDEPNRTHYKNLFALDATASPPNDLLNRTFGLAISPIPDRITEQKRSPNFPPLVEVRKAFLMQGLLSADILASLAPGPETGVTKAWFAPENGLAQNLMVLIQRLSRQFDQPLPSRPRGALRKDPELVYIAVTAVSVLRRIAEKSRDPVDASILATPFLPSSQALLDTTSLSSPEWTKEGLIQHFTACFNLGR